MQISKPQLTSLWEKSKEPRKERKKETDKLGLSCAYLSPIWGQLCQVADLKKVTVVDDTIEENDNKKLEEDARGRVDLSDKIGKITHGPRQACEEGLQPVQDWPDWTSLDTDGPMADTVKEDQTC